MASSPPLPRVCVTGGGGSTASWLVKLLLSRGYAVNATVRDPRDPKNACLEQLDGARENLRVFKADMLDYGAVTPALAGCEGVFHIATPVPEQEMVDPEASVHPSPGPAYICDVTIYVTPIVSSLRCPCIARNTKIEGGWRRQRPSQQIVPWPSGCGGEEIWLIKEMMDPTVKGTMNVLKACSAMNVEKLILVSSAASICFNPDWPEDKVKDESCWSDKEFCKENKSWYSLAKTEAEEIALEYGDKNGLHVITFCPGLVFGPLLQHVVLNTSSKVLLYMIKGCNPNSSAICSISFLLSVTLLFLAFITRVTIFWEVHGGPDTMNNKFWPIVDVRDVAGALLLLYNKAGPHERYICSLDQMDLKELLEIMKSMYPSYSYADKMVDVDYKGALTSDKLKNLGWKPRKLEDTLADSVESYEKAGLLHVSDGEPCRLPFFYRMPPLVE
ncbi:Anthocyanidin reductase [Triticum urartu]|uniref:Anthocyanidin reductase n=1 Tax=Triticum urartu TaxID=4572 RepID=M7YQD0_TRIUA|nr:Anthocyanidin reductase [Triticum urartu]